MNKPENHKMHEFKRILKVLHNKRSKSTELISLYVPRTKQIYEVLDQLKEELCQASNIMSITTKQNIIGAIESILSILKSILNIPKNGIVIFCESIDRSDNKTEIQTYIIEPPEIIMFYTYHCNSSFFIAPLENMLCKKDNTYKLTYHYSYTV